MATKRVEPSPIDEAFRHEMLAVLTKHVGSMPADRMLAVAAYTVGQILALQDQRTMTPSQGMTIIKSNIEAGNAHVIDDLKNKRAGCG